MSADTNAQRSGSTATIIRLPYTTSLGAYKGELLYNTTDFAIWTTVEVGVGITAGSLATLKPLFKSVALFTSNNRSSKMPWSRNTASRLGDLRGAQQLDDLAQSGGKTTTNITFAGSGARTSESDEEGILGKESLSGGNLRGINKSVTTTVVHERTLSRSEQMELSKNKPLPRATPEDHDSVLGYEERRKAHERL